MRQAKTPIPAERCNGALFGAAGNFMSAQP